MQPMPPPAMRPDKALTIGAYGETVAAYRYLVLAQKALAADERREFAAMADEEQCHKQRLQRLLAEQYPDADFYLRPDEKELVVVGPRLLDVRDEASFAQAMRFILVTERRTSQFYRRLSAEIGDVALRGLFEELAAEGVEHYQRLRMLAERSAPDVLRDTSE